MIIGPSALVFILTASFCVADEGICHGGLCSSATSDDTSFVQVALTIDKQTKKNLTHFDTPAPTEDPLTPADISGVSANASGDLTILIIGCIMNASIAFFFCLVTSILRSWYPLILCNNPKIIDGLEDPPTDWFSWMKASLKHSREDQLKACTLDAAMLMEYTVFCMRLCAWIGTPALFIAGPLCYFTGHGEAEKVGDTLSMIGINNVRPGHPYIYKLYGVMTIYVVVISHWEIMRSMRNFQKFRFEYLCNLKDPQATTVMVEAIPSDYQSKKKVKEFFSHVFTPDRVEEVYMVQYIPRLEKAYAHWERAKHSLDKAQAVCDKAKTDNTVTEKEEDAVKAAQKEVDKIAKQVTELRKTAAEKADAGEGPPNGHTAFVKFKHRQETRIALSMQFTMDADEWCISQPAEPGAIIWSDLKIPEERKEVQKVISYILVFLLYMSFTPFCVYVTNIADAINFGPFQPIWETYAPTLGLLIFLSFIPTVLIWIFSLLAAFKTDIRVQQQLQAYYFCFLVFFVLLVTVVGSDFAGFLEVLAQNPLSFPLVLADRMPGSTHYYLNYLSAQWFTHGMNLTRYIQVMKFIGFRHIWEDEDARQMSEPEDQDYYGMGSRSARFTSNMLIAIIFGILSPLMAWLAWVNFFVCRLFYGYLVVYAEGGRGKKADSGGTFLVEQLKHTYWGLLIFALLMIGIFTVRAPTKIPMVCSWIALIIAAWSLNRFNKQQWQTLPWLDMVESQVNAEKTDETYAQPALEAKLD